MANLISGKAIRVAKILTHDGNWETLKLFKAKIYGDELKYAWHDEKEDQCFESWFDTVYDAEIYLMQTYSVDDGQLKAKWAHL